MFEAKRPRSTVIDTRRELGWRNTTRSTRVEGWGGKFFFRGESASTVIDTRRKLGWPVVLPRTTDVDARWEGERVERLKET